MPTIRRPFPILLFLITSALVFLAHGQMYENTLEIFDTLLDRRRYHPEVIPVSNQSEVIEVRVDFGLLSIVTVDDATQSFVCNAVLTYCWTDQRLKWDPGVYGGKTVIHPLPKDIWRPRVILLNTLDDRDIFGDDISPVLVHSNGSVKWIPGSLFSTSCSLSLIKYPFDEQRCSIIMFSMGLEAHELKFKAGVKELQFYSVHGEWVLLDVQILTSLADSQGNIIPSFSIELHIRRRPTFYIFNIILPFVFLSFLNMLVFTIPQESGEKIAFGITVLLSLSVFFSIIGSMLPRSSNKVPLVIVYLFTLYVLSVLSVIDCMFILFLNDLGQGGEHQGVLIQSLKKLCVKVNPRSMRRLVHVRSSPSLTPTSNLAQKKLGFAKNPAADQSGYSNDDSRRLDDVMKSDRVTDNAKGDNRESRKVTNKRKAVDFKAMAALVDSASLMFFVFLWSCATIWFFVSVTC